MTLETIELQMGAIIGITAALCVTVFIAAIYRSYLLGIIEHQRSLLDLLKKKKLSRVGRQGRVKLPEVVMKQDLVDIGIRKVEIAKICEVSEPAVHKWDAVPKNKRSKIMKEVRRRHKLSGKLLNSGKK